MRIAFFGGSFNPPHYGHFLVASWALCGGFVDRVWMVPCYRHAFGKDLASYEDRIRMCELGTSAFAGRIEVSRIEEELGGPSYTIDVIEQLVQLHPKDQFFLLVGTDILHEKDQWKEFERLVELAPLLVAPRGGFHPQEGGFHIPEVASSQIRKKLSLREDISSILPPPILNYIYTHQLYSA